MAFVPRLLGLAAKIGLDLLIGTKRTEEAVACFGEWLGSRRAEEQAAEVVAANKRAANIESVRSAVEQAAAETGKHLDGQQLDDLSLSVSAGLDLLAASGHPDPVGFVKQLGSRRGTYAVWLDLEVICGNGPGRYCHFNWDDESFRVRDFIGVRIFHPPLPAGRRVAEEGLMAIELPMSALAVWQASRGRVQCLARYGLSFPVTERDRWAERMRVMSEVARLWADGEPGAAPDRGGIPSL